MALIVVGLSFRGAPVEVRERLALRDGLADLWPRLAAHCAEAVLLSTCNRCELYAVVDELMPARTRLVEALAATCGFPVEELAAYVYAHAEADAVQHLFRVACGLDSMIVGEGQILGQVRAAAEDAPPGTAGPILSALFRQATVTGKRARTETAIGQSAVSVSHAAVQLARRVFGDLRGRTVLLIGAGEMAELAARHLVTHNGARIVVANRTFERARELAERFGGEALPLTALEGALERCDIVVASTGAPEPVVTAAVVGRAMRARRGRPLFFVDIAVPRDVEPGVGAIENAFLYDIDDLQQLVTANVERRRGETAKVEGIVDQEVARFLDWSGARVAAPTIAALRERAEAIRQAELARAAPRLNELTERERNAVNALTQGIVNKLLHDPVVRLKLQAAGGPGTADYARLVRDLFGLDEPEVRP